MNDEEEMKEKLVLGTIPRRLAPGTPFLTSVPVTSSWLLDGGGGQSLTYTPVFSPFPFILLFSYSHLRGDKGEAMGRRRRRKPKPRASFRCQKGRGHCLEYVVICCHTNMNESWVLSPKNQHNEHNFYFVVSVCWRIEVVLVVPLINSEVHFADMSHILNE